MGEDHALLPVPCPRCGESQNSMPVGFNIAREPFGPVSCLVCGYGFSRDDYEFGLFKAKTRQRTGHYLAEIGQGRR